MQELEVTGSVQLADARPEIKVGRRKGNNLD